MDRTRDRHADFETHSGNHASVEPDHSQPLTGQHTLGEPTEAADDSRANPVNDLPDATTSQPHRTGPHIQVGDSVAGLRSAPPQPRVAPGGVQVSLSISTDGNEVTSTPAIKCMMCYH